MIFHEQAVLPAWNTTGTIVPMKTFFVDVILHAQITDTQGTVHAARGNQLLFHITLRIY